MNDSSRIFFSMMKGSKQVFTKMDKKTGCFRPFIFFAAALVAAALFFSVTDKILALAPDTCKTTLSIKTGQDTVAGELADTGTSKEDSVLQSLAKAGSTTPLELIEHKPESVLSVRNVAYVFIVIGLLILFMALLRKIVNRPVAGTVLNSQFQVLQQFPLGPKRTVYLVKSYGRLLLIGVTESAINTLMEISGQEEVSEVLAQIENTSGKEGQKDFSRIYQSLLSKLKKS